MRLTENAISWLERGALKGDPEVNAVDGEGFSYDAGQVCAIADGVRRSGVGYNEFQPNLQVKDVIWSGAVRNGAHMKWWKVTDCEDGTTEMPMLPSRRTKEVHSHFMKRWGASGKGCKLVTGRRFQLVTHTTKVMPAGPMFDHPTPVILVEGIRMEPRSSHQKKISKYFTRSAAGRESPTY